MGIGVVLICLFGALALLSAVQASHRARASADLSALAGAQALVDAVAGHSPCDVAAKVAAENQTTLAACIVEGDDLTVSVAAQPGWPGLHPARARARAGPGDGSPSD